MIRVLLYFVTFIAGVWFGLFIAALMVTSGKENQMNDTKEVLFDVYCPLCKHKGKKEDESPCDECLNEGVNLDSHKPVKWKEDK